MIYRRDRGDFRRPYSPVRILLRPHNRPEVEASAGRGTAVR